MKTIVAVLLALCFVVAAVVGVSGEAKMPAAELADAEAADSTEGAVMDADLSAVDEQDTDEAEAETDAEAESEADELEADEAEVEAEAETEEAEAEAELEAGADEDRFRESISMSAEADMSESEMSLESISTALAAMQFEDESDEAFEDAEDAQATAEEHAIASSARFQQRSAHVHYNESFAKEATVYAQGAYWTTDPEKCIHSLGHSSFELSHSVKETIFDGSSLFAITGVDNSKQRLVLAFHGDVAMKNLARRLWKGKPIKYKTLCKSCKTHKYFALVNTKICPEVIASTRLLVKEHPDYEVVITGHGMGGALAALCGYQLEMARVFKQTNRPRRFISYGAPRVGNCHWARKFNQIFPHAIRVTHANDPVAHIAPCHADPKTQRCIEVKDRKKRLWAYHFPTQIWYPNDMPSYNSSADGSFTVCNGVNWGEDEQCRSHPLGFSMADHKKYFGVDIANNCAAVAGAL